MAAIAATLCLAPTLPASAQPGSTPTPKVVARQGDSATDDMLASMFKYQFTLNASLRFGQADVAYISIETASASPTEGLMQRVAAAMNSAVGGTATALDSSGKPPRIAKASEASFDPKGNVQDPKSGKHGVVYVVKKIVPQGKDHYTVAGGYYDKKSEVTTFECDMKQQGSKWVVERASMIGGEDEGAAVHPQH
jgi:hypothetical protein